MKVKLEGLTFDVIKTRQDRGRDRVRLRHARTTPTSSSTALFHSKFATDDRPLLELPAHAQRGDRPRARRRARHLRRAARKAAYAAPAGRARAGRELAVARAPAARRRDLQARQRRRRRSSSRTRTASPAARRGTSRTGRWAGAMTAAGPAQARGAAADPAGGRRGNVRSRRGLAVRPGRRLRRRGVAGEPGAAGRDRRGLGLRPAAARALRPLDRQRRPGRPRQLGRRRRAARGGRDRRARRAARPLLVGGALADRARRRPRLRRARGRAARHRRRLGDPHAELLQHRRAVVLGRAARALRVLDRARLAARGRDLRSALRGRLGRRPRST